MSEAPMSMTEFQAIHGGYVYVTPAGCEIWSRETQTEEQLAEIDAMNAHFNSLPEFSEDDYDDAADDGYGWERAALAKAYSS